MEWCIHSSGIIFDLPIIYQHIQFLILPHPLTCSTYSSWTWGGLHQCPSTRHFVASRRIFFFSSLFTYPLPPFPRGHKRSHIPPPSLESDSDSSTPNHFSWLQSPSPFCQTYFMLLQTNTLCMTHLQGTTLTSTMMLMLLMYPTFPFIVLTSLYGHRKQVSQIVLVNLKEGPMNRGLIRPPYEYCLLMSSDIILDTYISDCIYSFLEWKYVR